MTETAEKTKFETSQHAAQTLAYIGDAVYELYIRKQLIRRFPRESAHDLHIRAINIVRASAQASAFIAIEHELKEDELSIYHRARNAKIDTVPKNADIVHYRIATGFEAVIGYLYLSEDLRRLDELLNLLSLYIWGKTEDGENQIKG